MTDCTECNHRYGQHTILDGCLAEALTPPYKICVCERSYKKEIMSKQNIRKKNRQLGINYKTDQFYLDRAAGVI